MNAILTCISFHGNKQLENTLHFAYFMLG